mmetsp:Transcript_24926/g.65426  ORF Transcript_24926/g.65426 Transcript_24926/m.65426 type:complete len:210 (-) Transcript_24926:129-758(-)
MDSRTLKVERIVVIKENYVLEMRGDERLLHVHVGFHVFHGLGSLERDEKALLACAEIAVRIGSLVPEVLRNYDIVFPEVRGKILGRLQICAVLVHQEAEVEIQNTRPQRKPMRVARHETAIVVSKFLQPHLKLLASQRAGGQASPKDEESRGVCGQRHVREYANDHRKVSLERERLHENRGEKYLASRVEHDDEHALRFDERVDGEHDG